MKAPHILLAAGNVRQMHQNLATVLDRRALRAIDLEIRANVISLMSLGRGHYLFAKRQTNKDWRQKISRFYYAAYSVSKGVRLEVSGEYSQEVKDHSRVNSLPDDFPDVKTYSNRLVALRADRNTCDYDHLGAVGDLAFTIEDTEQTVASFLRDARSYLRARGVHL